VVTWQVNVFSPFNVPDMFPPVSRGPRSQCPQEAVFRPASPPLPDIGFPPEMEIPGLMVNQTIVDDFLDWTSFDRSWPYGGYEADVEKDGDGSSNKENEWVPVPVDK